MNDNWCIQGDMATDILLGGRNIICSEIKKSGKADARIGKQLK